MRKDEFPLIDAYADSKVNEVLDKIKAEIANRCGVNTDYCDSCRFCTDSMKIREILTIINKYKAEIEPQESEVDNG